MEAPLSKDMSRNANDIQEIDQGNSLAATACFVLLFPICFPCSCWILQPRTEAVLLNCGTFTAIRSEPGLQFSNPVCQDIRLISTAQMSKDLGNAKITDSLGNPIICSGVLTFRFTDPKSALLNVQDPTAFVMTQAAAILKRVLAKYTYDELKLEGAAISKELVETLQPHVNVAGATIYSFSLNELNYAPEIAQSMLKKQAALALLDARQLIVKGAVDIATQALDQLKEKGVEMSNQDKFSLVSSLLIVICGDKDAQPTLAVV